MAQVVPATGSDIGTLVSEPVPALFASSGLSSSPAAEAIDKQAIATATRLC
jgi:hypothetical protein